MRLYELRQRTQSVRSCDSSDHSINTVTLESGIRASSSTLANTLCLLEFGNRGSPKGGYRGEALEVQKRGGVAFRLPSYVVPALLS